ncbi:MAG: hypothetical protein WDZ94_03625 [Patescibacteria group bacterium]
MNNPENTSFDHNADQQESDEHDSSKKPTNIWVLVVLAILFMLIALLGVFLIQEYAILGEEFQLDLLRI